VCVSEECVTVLVGHTACALTRTHAPLADSVFTNPRRDTTVEETVTKRTNPLAPAVVSPNGEAPANHACCDTMPALTLDLFQDVSICSRQVCAFPAIGWTVRLVALSGPSRRLGRHGDECGLVTTRCGQRMALWRWLRWAGVLLRAQRSHWQIVRRSPAVSEHLHERTCCTQQPRFCLRV
jgi:hypothetical protein